MLPALHPVDEFRAPSWLSDPALFVYVAALRGVRCARRRARRRPAGPRCCPCWCSRCSRRGSVRFAADVALVAAPLLAVGADARSAIGCGPAGRSCVPDPVPSVGVAALLAGLAAGPRLGGQRRRDRPRHARAAAVRDRVRRRERPARSHVQRLRDRLVPAVRSGRRLSAPPRVRRSAAAGLSRRVPPPARPRRPDPRRVERGDGRLRRRDRAARVRRASTGASPGGIRNARRSCSAKRTRACSSGACRGSRALIASREIPATFAFSPQEGTATLPLDDAAGRVAGPRLRMAAAARRSDVRARRRRRRRARWPPTIARWRRPPAACAPPTRRGWRPGWARSRSAPGARRTRWPLFDRALARGDGELTTLTNRAVALEGARPHRRRGGGVGRGDRARRRVAAGGAGPRAPRPPARAVDVDATSRRRTSARRLLAQPDERRAQLRAAGRRCWRSTDQLAGADRVQGRAELMGGAVAVHVEQRRGAGEVEVEPAFRRRRRTRRRGCAASAPRPSGRRWRGSPVALADGGAQQRDRAPRTPTSLPSASACASAAIAAISPPASGGACAGRRAPARRRRSRRARRVRGAARSRDRR